MALTINTNMSSLIVQKNLNAATSMLNKSIERMTTGYKINHAADNAAGYSIATTWKTQLGSLDVASDNASTGADMLTTLEDTYSLITSHLQRVRDLTEQAANGTYASASLKAIQSEISARLDEITRVASNAEFNGIKLMSFDGTNGNITGMNEKGIDLQVGLYGDGDSIINLDIDLFKSATISGLFTNMIKANGNGVTLQQMLEQANNKQAVDLKTTDEEQKIVNNKIFAAACSGLIYDSATDSYTLASGVEDSYGAKEMLSFLDSAIDDISSRVIGAAQNRVESAITAIDVQSQNLTSSLSTLRDTDVAEESSNYIQSQILQQASATLLATANQTPSIALNLL